MWTKLLHAITGSFLFAILTIIYNLIAAAIQQRAIGDQFTDQAIYWLAAFAVIGFVIGSIVNIQTVPNRRDSPKGQKGMIHLTRSNKNKFQESTMIDHAPGSQNPVLLMDESHGNTFKSALFIRGGPDSQMSPNELRSAAQSLKFAVNEMNKTLSVERRERANKALDSLVREALNTIPDRNSRWDFEATYLIEIASNAGSKGQPVLDMLNRLLPALYARG